MSYSFLDDEIKTAIDNKINDIVEYINTLILPFDRVAERYLLKKYNKYSAYLSIIKTKKGVVDISIEYLFANNGKLALTLYNSKPSEDFIEPSSLLDSNGKYTFRVFGNQEAIVNGKTFLKDYYAELYMLIILNWKKDYSYNYQNGLKGAIDFNLDTNHLKDFKV